MSRVISQSFILTLLTLLLFNGCQTTQSCCDSDKRGFVSLFDGKDFTHWDNSDGVWSIEDGAMVSGDLDKVAEKFSWLYTYNTFKDFELHLEAKIVGDLYRNSGIWYRATPFLFTGHDEDEEEDEQGEADEPKEEEMEDEGEPEEEDEWQPFMAPAAYEFDMFVIEQEEYDLEQAEAQEHEEEMDEEESEEEDDGFEWVVGNYWGSIGDWFVRPNYRHLGDQEKLNKAFKPLGWNSIVIRCQGNHLQHWVNGELVLDHVDNSPQAHTEGKIGLQVHDGTKMKAYFKNIKIKEL